MVLYALHDALVKPMPCRPQCPEPGRVVVDVEGRAGPGSPCSARGRGFHNGDPVTADDVKVSFERYRRAAAPPQGPVRDVQVVDPAAGGSI